MNQLKRDLTNALKGDPSLALWQTYLEAMDERAVLDMCAKVDENLPILELFVGKDNAAKILPVVKAFNAANKLCAASKHPT